MFNSWVNNILILILIIMIICITFTKSKQENLENVNVLDIIHTLVSHPNIKDPKKPKTLVNFTRNSS